MTLPVGGVGAVPAAGAAVAPGATAAAPRGATARAGEAFERALLSQLTKTLADSALGGDDASTSAAPSAYRDMIPDALTDALMRDGGIGLSGALTR